MLDTRFGQTLLCIIPCIVTLVVVGHHYFGSSLLPGHAYDYVDNVVYLTHDIGSLMLLGLVCSSSGAFGWHNCPATHMSQRLWWVESQISWRMSSYNMSEPVGCSKWKWQAVLLLRWKSNNASHKRRCTSSSTLACMTLRAISTERAALNWLHLFHALHDGDIQMFSGKVRKIRS